MKRLPIYTVVFLAVWLGRHYGGWKLEVDNDILSATLWALLAVFVTWMIAWFFLVLRKG